MMWRVISKPLTSPNIFLQFLKIYFPYLSEYTNLLVFKYFKIYHAPIITI